MNKLYKEIVDLVEELGTKAKLENKPVKVLDLETGVLILEPKSGWLAIRKDLECHTLSSQRSKVYFDKVLYKKKDYPYCALKSDLEDVKKQITAV